ncbi:hypothetical protein EDD66_105251 [Mobilisporobacter senegalensis]|uniref:Uncharacterized protein n=1 Tax=Mobilisporobacter senegalensis TaxID=1329262 RepID=A0A3N1XNP6_9FIRM|nr:hypothetical protein [Mobilisporobacter senegalensis]ROR28310.1 hypothetical protein EDD66_105251 [Mobilisporobacter senegalensis]
MNLYGNEIPNILIKICEKEEYAKDVKNGKIYMKESGYFRKLEENHRGDIYDGKMPIHGNLDIKIGLKNGRIKSFKQDFPDLVIKEIDAGMVNDDKFPIYCTTILNENITEYISDKEFNFKNEFIEEMKNFGRYAVVFNADELIHKSSKYLVENKLATRGETACILSTINYCDIHNKYTIKDTAYIQNLIQFYNKDLSYKWQNECRLIILNNRLIPSDKDHFIMQIGELETAVIIPIDELNSLEL